MWVICIWSLRCTLVESMNQEQTQDLNPLNPGSSMWEADVPNTMLIAEPNIHPTSIFFRVM